MNSDLPRARIPHLLLHLLLQSSLLSLPVLPQGPFLPGAQWVIQGTTEADYHLHKVGVVFHSHHTLLDITRHLSQTQAGQKCTGWLPPGQACLPGTLYELLSSWVPGDCMAALAFSMHELSLLCLQHHMQQQPGVAPHLVEELFLGDVHTDWAESQYYRPTGYQCPLQSALVSMESCGDALVPAQQLL